MFPKKFKKSDCIFRVANLAFIIVVFQTKNHILLLIYMFLLQETLKALMDMRRVSKEKELEALLSAENDSCSCYIEVA